MRFVRLPMRAAALSALLLAFGSAHAQRNVPAVKTSNPPKIDGKIEAAEWAQASQFTEGYDEQTGAPPPPGFEQTFWLEYDEKFIYIAGRLNDPEPKKISATETRMNVSVKSEDHMIFAIDPFGNLQNLNQFRINANGATTLEIAGGRAPKREWIGEILAAGRITEKGWECEARIPWSIMQIPPPGKRTLRADFGRLILRTGRAYLSSNLVGDQMQHISNWVDVDLPKSGVRHSLKLLPFGYAGFSKNDSEVIANSGLDLKTSLSNQLELVGTANPDFRNIENNVLSLDFSYFERLAGESRPFFLEGQRFFHTSEDASLFASQRIKTFDTGLKVYGVMGKNDQVAFLNTDDFGHTTTLVGNVEHQIRPRESFQIAGTLLDQKGFRNTADFFQYSKGFGPNMVFGQYSSTQDDEKGDGTRFNAGWNYQNQGLESLIEYQEISPEFIPRLGFAPRVDFKGWHGGFDWNRPNPHGSVMETSLEFSTEQFDRFHGGDFLTNYEGGQGIVLRDSTRLQISEQYEEIEGFKDHLYQASVGHPRGDIYRHWQIDYGWGNVAGHDFKLFSPSLSYRPLKPFQIQLRHQDLQHIENERQTILSMNYELNKFESFSSRLIRRDNDTNVYFAWRRSGNRGIEYYVILGDPNARTFHESIILKAVMPIEVVLGKR